MSIFSQLNITLSLLKMITKPTSLQYIHKDIPIYRQSPCLANPIFTVKFTLKLNVWIPSYKFLDFSIPTTFNKYHTRNQIMLLMLQCFSTAFSDCTIPFYIYICFPHYLYLSVWESSFRQLKSTFLGLKLLLLFFFFLLVYNFFTNKKLNK